MLSKDFRSWSESFERGWVKKQITSMGCSIMAAGVSLGAKGRTKTAWLRVTG